MTQIQRFLRTFQLQYCQTNPLTKAVVAAAIVLSTITLVSLRLCQWDAQERLENLQEQAALLEQQNQDLSQRIAILGTDESIRQIATEELDMVDPDVIIIDLSE